MQTIYTIILLFISCQAQADEVLAIGESINLPVSSQHAIHIQKKGILKIKDQGLFLRVTGKKIGETSIQVGQKKYNFQVIKINRYKNYKKLLDWQKNKRGPQIKVRNNQVFLGGRILKATDFYSLKDLNLQQPQFSNLAEFEPDQKEKVKSFLDNRLRENNLQPGQISWSPHLKMGVQISNKAMESAYKKILSPFGIEVQLSKNYYSQKPLVRVKVFIAQVKKTFLRQWGMQWPSQFSAQIIPKQSPVFENLLLTLNALEGEGLGKTLAQPTLVAESGTKAEFHSGGEFPIQTSTQFSNSVEWKRYGLNLQTTPKVNSRNQMHFDIKIEISTLNTSQGQNGIPALSKNSIHTKINLESPQPFLLSGFSQFIEQQSDQGLPWLRQIPIFSSLFSSGNRRFDDFEIVFILVPSIYE